jgi:hypothetical protein
MGRGISFHLLRLRVAPLEYPSSFPGKNRDNSQLDDVHTDSGSDPASSAMDTSDAFLKDKAVGAWSWLLKPNFMALCLIKQGETLLFDFAPKEWFWVRFEK